MDSLTIDFATPIVVGTLTYDRIVLSVPLVKHLRAAAKCETGIDAIATLIQQVGKVPASVVDEMTQPDFQRAQDFFDRFATSTPATPVT